MSLKSFLKLLKKLTFYSNLTWQRYSTTNIFGYISGYCINIWLDDDDHCYIKINDEIYIDIRDDELDNLVWDLIETTINKGHTIPSSIFTKLEKELVQLC